MLVISEIASTRMPAWRAMIVSGTVLMPTASAPRTFSMRISAGVSNCGPSTQANTPSCSRMPRRTATSQAQRRNAGS